MNTNLTKKAYQAPVLWEIPVIVEGQFLASQLDDYSDNPIFGDDDDL